MTLQVTARDLDIMARTLYGECRGEPFSGQVAVAWVIRRRAESPSWWGHGIEGVCKAPKQFSCWNDEKMADFLRTRVYALDPMLTQLAGVAALVLSDALPDTSNRATHYMRADITGAGKWDEEMVETARIGAHAFFKDRAK